MNSLLSFWRCAKYLILLGCICFFLGRLISLIHFRADLFPFKPFSFEKNGTIYNKLNIRKWHNRVPDMSRMLPVLIPKKRLSDLSPEALARMINETCVAEVIHVFLFLASLYCLKLWSGIGGICLVVVYNVLGNIPFILIQRFNRPRLVSLLNHHNRHAVKVQQPIQV